jgi:hypothetical protein
MINAIQNGILPNNQVNQGSNNIKKNSYNFMLKINGASLIEAPSVSLAPEPGAARSLLSGMPAVEVGFSTADLRSDGCYSSGPD